MLRGAVRIKDALCTELHSTATGSQRYVYVEFEPGADRNTVADVIRSDPLFLDVETLVLPVQSVAALEEEGHGVIVQRRGTAGRTGHQLLLLEARFDRWALAAQMMIAATRAVQQSTELTSALTAPSPPAPRSAGTFPASSTIIAFIGNPWHGAHPGAVMRAMPGRLDVSVCPFGESSSNRWRKIESAPGSQPAPTMAGTRRRKAI